MRSLNRLLSFVFCPAAAALVFFNSVAVASPAEGLGSPGTHRELAREIFQQLIEINTTVDSGSTRAAEAIAARLRAAGFPANDIHVIGAGPKNMNLVVRYSGENRLRPILFIGHLDVVQALRQDWSFDPFTLVEKDGYFYGRGTTDIKCDDASLIAGLILLKREGFTPNRDIIVALTEGEETGVANGINWLLANRRDLIDAEFCINPDGGGGDIIGGRHAVLNVQTGEKTYLSYQLEARNKGGHSSLPTKDNAIYHLAGALARLAAYDFPVRLNETTRLRFERGAIRETGQMKLEMLAVSRTPTDTAAANRLASSSPYYNALMRTTCVATLLSGGHAENALPQTATATVNCRLLPDEDPESVTVTLRSVIGDSQVIVTCHDTTPQVTPLSPVREDVMKIVERLTASMWPGVVVVPLMSTGATDGLQLRKAGMPVYGISGMFTDINDVRAHGRDERLGVNEFYDGVEFMYRFIKAISR